jgi:SAM-dependent methyltransferase
MGWERAAPHYDECWTDTRLFVEPLLNKADVRAGTRLLDVACGPGYVSEAAAARGAEAVGVDVAEAMIELPRSRLPDLEFVVGDAQRLPLADRSFDVVTMSFGILHLAEPTRALAEVRRVLAPGRRFAFTAWVDEGNAAAEIVDNAVAAHAAPIDLPAGPDFYLFADEEYCQQTLTRAGFEPTSVRVETVTVQWQLPTAERLVAAELRAGVRTGAILRAQPPERLQQIRAAIVEKVARYADNGGFMLPIVARVIHARSAAAT